MQTKYPIVYVKWSDVAGDWQWTGFEEARASEPKECETAGFLVNQNDNKIVIAASHCIADGDVMDYIAIPKSLLKSLVYLEEKNEH